MNSPGMRSRCAIAALVCILAAATQGCVRQRPVTVRAPKPQVSKPSPAEPDLSEYIRTAIKLSKENTAAAEARAARHSLEDPELAELERRVAADADDSAGRRRLAGAYLAKKLYVNAFQLYQEIQAKNPDDAGVAVAIAEIWDAWGDYSLARRYAERAVELDAKMAAAFDVAGRIELHSGRLDSALASFEAALALEPVSASVLNNAGYVCLLQGKWEKARAHLERALELDASIPEAQNNLGVALGHLGDYDGALRRFMAANPPAAAHNNVGVLYLTQKRWAEAHEQFRQALAIDPSYSKAQANLREAAAQIRPPTLYTVSFGRPAQASVAAPPSSLLGAAEYHPISRVRLEEYTRRPWNAAEERSPAVTELAAGRDWPAPASYTQIRVEFSETPALSAPGVLPELRRSLGDALANLPDGDGALSQRAVSKRTAAAAHNLLGLVHLDQKRFKEAREEFCKALAANPGDASARANLREAESHLPPPRVYTVQIAPRRTPEQAAAAAEKPIKAGAAPEIVRADADDKGLWNRARLYGYSSWKTAVEMARKLLTGDYWITRSEDRRNGS